MMNYTVTVSPFKRSVTVEYEGYKGTARCCPTDAFDLNTGIELALERAKVAKKNAENANTKATKPTVMELVRALEQALPKGEMVVVGNGSGLTTAHKQWLHSLTDCKGGYDAGYAAGYAKCVQEYEDIEEQCEEYITALERVRELLDEVNG